MFFLGIALLDRDVLDVMSDWSIHIFNFRVSFYLEGVALLPSMITAIGKKCS